MCDLAGAMAEVEGAGVWAQGIGGCGRSEGSSGRAGHGRVGEDVLVGVIEIESGCRHAGVDGGLDVFGVGGVVLMGRLRHGRIGHWRRGARIGEGRGCENIHIIVVTIMGSSGVWRA